MRKVFYESFHIIEILKAVSLILCEKVKSLLIHFICTTSRERAEETVIVPRSHVGSSRRHGMGNGEITRLGDEISREIILNHTFMFRSYYHREIRWNFFCWGGGGGGGEIS